MQRLSTLFLLLASASAACSREEPASRALPGDGASRVAAEQSGFDANAELVIPADAPVVAFLGDSLCAGLHLPVDEAFPAVVQRELAGAGTPFRLVNAGVSGDTTAGGLRRLDWVLGTKPDVVVVELGSNDGLRGQPLESVEANLRQIVTRLQTAGVRVLLLGMQMPPNLGAEYSAAFEALYARVADETGVAFVPRFLSGVGGDPTMNLEDGLHPTAEGHRRLAANLRDSLAALLAAER